MQTDPTALIIVAIIGAGGLVSVALINLYGVRLANRNAEHAAAAVKGVEIKLAETSAQADKKLDEIHSAVNSRLSVAQNTITWLEQQLYAARQEPAVPLEVAIALPDTDPRREPTDTRS